jgi:hypothetical protein
MKNFALLSKSIYMLIKDGFCHAKAIASTAAVHVRNLPIVPQLCKFAYKSTRIISDSEIIKNSKIFLL